MSYIILKKQILFQDKAYNAIEIQNNENEFVGKVVTLIKNGYGFGEKLIGKKGIIISYELSGQNDDINNNLDEKFIIQLSDNNNFIYVYSRIAFEIQSIRKRIF